MSEEKKIMAPCCENCAVWEQHQHRCWFFWEGKKECTQHSSKTEGQNFSKIIK